MVEFDATKEPVIQEIQSASEGALRNQVTKAYVLDKQGGMSRKYPSKQLNDPFSDVTSYGQLIREPPYSFEQLVALSESHPTHAAAIEQKAADVIASGFNVSLRQEYTDDPSAEYEDLTREVLDWWDSLFEDFTSTETLLAMWEDYEILGWGILEVARDEIDRKVRRLYHIPAHTVRVTKDGELYVQVQDGKMVWFKAWGVEDDFMSSTGRKAPSNAKFENLANELLVFRKPSRSSYWYGLPMYISSLAFITLTMAARNFNLEFFDNYREPRHLILISGLETDVGAML